MLERLENARSTAAGAGNNVSGVAELVQELQTLENAYIQAAAEVDLTAPNGYRSLDSRVSGMDRAPSQRMWDSIIEFQNLQAQNIETINADLAANTKLYTIILVTAATLQSSSLTSYGAPSPPSENPPSEGA